MEGTGIQDWSYGSSLSRSELTPSQACWVALCWTAAGDLGLPVTWQRWGSVLTVLVSASVAFHVHFSVNKICCSLPPVTLSTPCTHMHTHTCPWPSC
jgi:hypothetical protein